MLRLLLNGLGNAFIFNSSGYRAPSDGLKTYSLWSKAMALMSVLLLSGSRSNSGSPRSMQGEFKNRFGIIPSHSMRGLAITFDESISSIGIGSYPPAAA